jgi:hypothetical protein
MTDADWMASKIPGPMIEHLWRTGKGGDRKMRLFVVACCRRIGHLFPDESCRRAVDLAETYADCGASQRELTEAMQSIYSRAGDLGLYNQSWNETAHGISHAAAYASVRAAIAAVSTQPSMAAETARWASVAVDDSTAMGGFLTFADLDDLRGSADESFAQAGLLREIYGGHPNCETAFCPSWKTPATLRIAAALYAEGVFDAMPILGDALEEAGCDDAEVLAHCRSPSTHVRGCWVADGLLGKSYVASVSGRG